MKSRPERIPWRFRRLALDAFKEIEVRDFENKKDTGRKYVTEISSPKVDEFTQWVAAEFLKLYGARKLCSFIQRCNLGGPWAEIVVVWKKNKWGENKKFKYSKLEFEFVKLQKIYRSNLKISDQDLRRYEELLVTMDQKLMNMADEELLELANQWISKIKDRVL